MNSNPNNDLQPALQQHHVVCSCGGGSAVAYAWYVWQKGFNGTTELKWFN